MLDAQGNPFPTKIALRTRSDKDIENQQLWHIADFEWNKLVEFDKYAAKKVSDACPIYNCHGLTFGSRRTSVYESPLFVLGEDGFEQIPERDTRVGDIVVYFDSNGAESHTGIVIGEEYLGAGDTLQSRGGRLPLIWSKWAKGPEFVHTVGNCPYDASTVRYFRLVWRRNEQN